MTMVVIPRRRTGTDCRRRRLRLCRAPALLCSGAPVRLLPPRSQLPSSVKLCRASSCSTLFLCACAPVLQLVLPCSNLYSSAPACTPLLLLAFLCTCVQLLLYSALSSAFSSASLQCSTVFCARATPQSREDTRH